MLDNKKGLFIIGYSGHAYVILEAVNQQTYTVKGYFDLKEVAQNPYSIPFMGSEKDNNFTNIVKNSYVFPSIGANSIRKRLVDYLTKLEVLQTNIIAPSACVSPSLKIGYSNFISNGAIINAQAKLGYGIIINTGAIVEHECKIGSYTHIAPGATLTGNVTVGESSFIGANAIVKQGISIGNNVTVGAGTVVLKDIPDGKTVVGNPGRSL